MEGREALFLREYLLPQLRSEHAVTLRILQAIPAGQEGYRPEPASRSAGELGIHIALCELWFLDAILAGAFGEFGAVPEGAALAEWYAGEFAARVARIEGMSGEELARGVNFLDLREDPAVAFLNIAIRHTVHHRGQLSAYLRPMGGRVPAIYVESGDEPYSGEEPDREKPPAF